MANTVQNGINGGVDFEVGSPLEKQSPGTYINEVRKIKILDINVTNIQPIENLGNAYGNKSYFPKTTDFAPYSMRAIKWTGEKWVIISEDEYNRLKANASQYKNDAVPVTRYTPVIEEVESVRYPFDIATHASNDFVIFDFFDYQPPFSKNKVSGNEYIDGKGNVKTGVDQFNGNLDAYNRTGVASDLYTPDRENYPQLILYMPDDISDTLSAGWEGKSFGNLTGSILSAAARKGTLKKLEQGFNVAAKTIQKAPAEAAAALATSLAKSITGDQITTGDVFGTVSGVIRNPNAEILFQKMNFRTFDLTFKMAPYNDLEAQEVMTIIRTFRKAMLPQYGLQGKEVTGYGTDKDDENKKITTNKALDAAFVKVPKVCSVHYMRGGDVHPFLPRYKMCAITDVAVNYTPDGNYAIFEDGMPVAVELKVSFMETKLIFSEDVGNVYGKKLKRVNSNTFEQLPDKGGY